MAYDPASVTARYDVLRNRLKQDAAQNQSEQDEALKRRFAAQGMLNSGAYQKSQELQNQQLGEQQQKGMEDINFAEQNEQQRQKELEEGRQYQTSEREATQKYQTGEREQTQFFNKDLFNQDLNFKKMVQEQNFGLAQQELSESKRANFANFAIALRTAGIPNDQIEDLFSRAGDVFSRINVGGGGGSGGDSSGGGGGGYGYEAPGGGGGIYTPSQNYQGNDAFVGQYINSLFNAAQANPNFRYFGDNKTTGMQLVGELQNMYRNQGAEATANFIKSGGQGRGYYWQKLLGA